MEWIEQWPEEEFAFLFNHIFLPPKLPQQAENDVEDKNSALIQLVLHAVRGYSALAGGDDFRWSYIEKMLRNMSRLQSHGSFDARTFQKVWRGLNEGEDTDLLALHINSQNCGLIIRKKHGKVVFESFEASPLAKEVIGSRGKLRCSFPGPAVEIDAAIATDAKFIMELAGFLEKIHLAALDQVAEKSAKAGGGESLVSEERETVSPKLVTELLSGILRGVGRASAVQRIEKRVADDVLWQDGTLLPWRRSPLWLVVRVALHTTMTAQNGFAAAEYKSLLIYLAAKILEKALGRNCPSDVLYLMNAKVSRRVYKMPWDALPRWLVDEAQRIGDAAAFKLQGRWTTEQEYHSKPHAWAPKVIDAGIKGHLRLSLDSCKDYLDSARSMNLAGQARKAFRPEEHQRIELDLTYDLSIPRPVCMAAGAGAIEKDLALADFESWARTYLPTWVNINQNAENSCSVVQARMEEYVATARQQYKGNPERMSVLYLTMMEMWVALDTVAQAQLPMLREYDPGFADGFLGSLLLPEPEQRLRLRAVERYVGARRAECAAAPEPTEGIFSKAVKPRSFAVRYFRASAELQALEAEIQEAATARRDGKKRELARKMAEYEGLVASAQRLACEYNPSPVDGSPMHNKRCQKCVFTDQADRMRIEAFEWPLPGDELSRQAVVFELRCPQAFAAWREATFRTLAEVSVRPPAPAGAEKPLDGIETYAGLKDYYRGPFAHAGAQALRWASPVKSYMQSHYRLARLPTTLSNICLANPLRYRLFDKAGGVWADEPLGPMDVAAACTLLISPASHYKNLQYAVSMTTHSSNLVLARQSECPHTLQQHEYLAFGFLRAGHRLQWLNILRELRSRTLTFGDLAVNMLFTQAAWQAGPAGQSARLRDSHTELANPVFGRSLAHELGQFLESVQGNWQELTSVHTLIVLGMQLASYAQEAEVVDSAVRFIRKARAVCVRWVQELSERLHDQRKAQPKEAQARLVSAAVVCRETFNAGSRRVQSFWGGDAEKPHLIDRLLNSRQDLAVIALCATAIHENSPKNLFGQPASLRMMLDRDRRIAHALEPEIRTLVLSKSISLDLSLCWNAYRMAPWAASPINKMWLVSLSRVGAYTQEVFYNVITGKLLVNGNPVGRMPVEYTSHPNYVDLFGERLLDVYPSSMDGMVFQAKMLFAGRFEVSFALVESDLIIRARNIKNDGIQQLIPRLKLQDDFPAHITKDSIAWLDMYTGNFEFRAKKSPWSYHEIWRTVSHLYPTRHKVLVNFLNGTEIHLVDVRSPTAKMITECLSPLEYAEFIQIEYDEKNDLITAHLPRLKLDFQVIKGVLTCRQYTDMQVDSERSFGTLTGLDNRLVVRQGSTRSVLIPHGKISMARNARFHVNVDINTRDMPDRVRYHLYTIDETLGRLVGNGSLISHLYKIYLHAVTSSCLPDILTGRTGTEEALHLLRSAATWSFQSLDPDEADLFSLIARLSPVRAYYPLHLRFMQTVTWNDGLWPLSQHDEFQRIVEDIWIHSSRFTMFKSPGSSQLNLRLARLHSDPHLCRRAITRNASFRTEDIYSPGEGRKADAIYTARDGFHGSPDEARVRHMADLVRKWPSSLPVFLDLFELLNGWGIIGDPAADLSIGFGYDHRWLDPNLPGVWFHLLEHLGTCTYEDDKYSLMFLFGSMTFGGKVKLEIIRMLLAFATAPGLQRFRKDLGNIYETYDFTKGFEPVKATLTDHWAAMNCFIDFEESDEAKLPGRAGEEEYQTIKRRSTTYETNREIQFQALAAGCIKQWPRALLAVPLGQYPLIKIFEAVIFARELFSQWFRNKTFQDTLKSIEHELNSINNNGKDLFPLSPFPLSPFTPCRNTQPSESSSARMEEILQASPPNLPPIPRLEQYGLTSGMHRDAIPTGTDQFGKLLRDFSEKINQPQAFEKVYAEKLETSYNALRDSSELATVALPMPNLMLPVVRFNGACRAYLKNSFMLLTESLTPIQDTRGWMSFKAGLWPRISTMSLLQRLASNNTTATPLEWRLVLMAYAKGIAQYQLSSRLLRLYRKEAEAQGRDEDVRRELANPGHQNWDPLNAPDWLLLEIENNMLIRPVQADIARQMITPENNSNAIMQLCMGEGKTSVIVPIVSADLADGKKLVRVVVLKPLSGQMFQMLVKKLGGLLNRRIFFMPFSRGVRMGPDEVKQIRQLFEDCMRHGGILLVQPEHILSFKLLGLERYYDADVNSRDSVRRDVAVELIKIQTWLNQNSRDILDESDEILSTKHELIYTLGNSRPIENHPLRWMVVQEVLDMIRRNFQRTQSTNDFEIEEAAHSGGFDFIRILDQSAGQRRLKEVALDYIREGTRAVHFRFASDSEQQRAIRFITEPELKWQDSEAILGEYRDNFAVKNTLFLLRGLFAHKILLFALHEKRWKVDYGLDLTRSMLAVPYRAKDSPSAKSEFSHPDVAITLTCLSYYYGGLTDDDLQICFRNLYKSENPVMEYERWMDGVLLDSPKFKHLNSINLEDKEQWTGAVVPLFKHNKAVIDFYLNTKVFPLQAKEFEKKLSSSGWDISEKKTHPTTGFSGTNDNQYFLPLTIKQIDTKEQLNTNARVMSYLLQSENSYMPIVSKKGQRLSVEELLQNLVLNKLDIQVLLDVGAQVLEFKNEEVAEKWLDYCRHNPAIRAAVYFDDQDELSVITRDKVKEPLRVSAFADQLDGCLVYLDELHTRGTDLKLPWKSKAAVTLGPGLTKDRLVQACMRMRKLGTGHSVLFCGPPEIDRKVKRIAMKDNRESIEVRDVLYWCMNQTCITTRKYVPIWAKQGISYHNRSNTSIGISAGQGFPTALLEKECKTLEEHYGWDRKKGHVMPAMSKSFPMLTEIKNSCAKFGVSTFAGAPMLEEQEQERELSHEIEAQRETQRPPRADPVKPVLSSAIEEFIKTGRVRNADHSFLPAFEVLAETSARSIYVSRGWTETLLCTRDFANVVVTYRNSSTDEFLRPVQWVISAPQTPGLLVIVSPHEVQHLLPRIRISTKVTLHMYNARTTKASASYEGLDVYTIPQLPPPTPQYNPALEIRERVTPAVIDQLNLFSGQLYFVDYEAYRRVTAFLGLWLDEKPFGVDVEISTLDGFVRDVEGRRRLGMPAGCCPFGVSVVGMVRALVGFRRRGQGFVGTHVGRVLHGRCMVEEDFV
ncbi:hypothetical protein DFH27DRAFT_653152 [Peziza echinospora]|nr:hypothetical protein DFH27DRAFT_653152 [Peziza echinospora]